MGEISHSGFNSKKMKLIIIAFLIGCAHFSFGQQKELAKYLLFRIDALVDVNGKDYYYAINAERGCDSAEKIYELKKYDNKKNALNNEGSFYHKEKDTVNNLYNYFLSPTEALNFLSKSGWTLFSIYTEVLSGYDNQRSGAGEIVPITTVYSRPVFCFKKN